MAKYITKPVSEALLTLASLFLIFFASASVTQAYVYNGYKWSSYPVSVDVGAWPAGWVTPLASSMTTWNNATSPFYFNSGSSGHQFKTANNGAGNPPAVTFVSGSGSTITDCDTVFNTSLTWSTSGAAGALDVQNVATHELGHWLSLADLSGGGDTEKTMYYLTALGETKKRTLETDDLNGINAIYP